MCACDSEGAREESAQAGEAVRRKARKQRHRNNRVGSVLSAAFTKRWAALGRQLIFALMILFRWKF